ARGRSQPPGTYRFGTCQAGQVIFSVAGALAWTTLAMLARTMLSAAFPAAVTTRERADRPNPASRPGPTSRRTRPPTGWPSPTSQRARPAGLARAGTADAQRDPASTRPRTRPMVTAGSA